MAKDSPIENAPAMRSAHQPSPQRLGYLRRAMLRLCLAERDQSITADVPTRIDVDRDTPDPGPRQWTFAKKQSPP